MVAYRARLRDKDYGSFPAVKAATASIVIMRATSKTKHNKKEQIT